MINIEKEQCTACGACYNICPNNSIQMVSDNEGFIYPLIDKNKCISCGLCESVCPILNKHFCKNTKEPKVFAAWSLDEEIRINSTSGGIFSELARTVVSQGGYVVGAKYTTNHLVEHTIINNEESISAIRQSKYVQSAINFVFRDIKYLLDRDKIVMFVGTPCQCYGLLNFLNKTYENLFLCDFICRGVNSPKVYLAYLESLKKKYNSSIKKVWFKNKINGWNKFCTKIEFDNGKEYFADRYTDLYMVGYLKYNLFMRPSCSKCNFKGFPRYSDITLSDFWGVKLKEENLDSDKGTSLVLINSQKGQKYFSRIKDNIFMEESNIEAALPFNSCAVKSAIKGEKRDYFFSKIDKFDFDELLNMIITK